MSLRKRSVAATFSIASRALFFLYVSTKVYKTADPLEVVDFFQLLFLQSVLVTFLSASSYFRVLERKEEDDAALMVRTHIIFSLLGCLFISSVYVFFWKDSADSSLYLMLGFGAGMMSISGALTGRTLREKGAALAFLPSTASAILCLFLAFLSSNSEPKSYLLLVIMYQSLTAVILFSVNLDLMREFFEFRLNKLMAGFWEQIKSNFSFGLVNTYAVALLYFFREAWSLENDAVIVSTAFFIVRLSDIGLQLFMTVLASNALLEKLPRLINTKVISVLVIIFSVVILCVILFSLSVSLEGKTPEMVFLTLLMVQVLIDIVRYPISLIFLKQVANQNVFKYVWYILVPVSLTFLTGKVLGWELQVYGLYLFLGMTSFIGLFVYVIQYGNIKYKATI